MSPSSRGGAGWSDAVELLQGTAGGVDEFGQLRVGGFDLLVDDGDLGDQLRGQLAAGASDDVAGADRVEQSPGLRRGQELLRAARDEFE